jgi:alcohol dehydrogenase (cytochrome c)
MARATLAALTILALLPHPLAAQVTFERLLDATDEPHNWLTYSGNYDSNRHTTLDQITVDNVDRLELQWVLQAQSLQVFQTTPLVVDGIMYITEAPNTVLALDAELGRVFWRYEYTPAQESRPCCGRVNRGVAILGETLFMGTIDAQLIAIDAVSGRPIWQTSVAEPGAGYALTLAPLIVKDKVIVSVAGGEYGIRGFISAYDPETGEEEWRFYTIPGPGEPGHDTWQGDDWRYGGASAWITGSYDPDVDLIYWGIGNPGPDWNPSQRPGDNLYSDSVVALDPDTGELEWYFQFTPHDIHDWDAIQVPILGDIMHEGEMRRVMMWANRNAFYYTLDRETGEFLVGKPYARQTWAEGLDENGRPVRVPNMEPSPEGTLVSPTIGGGTNWWSPTFSPRTGLFYVNAFDGEQIYFIRDEEYVEGEQYTGGGGESAGPIDNYHSAVRAIDPATGDLRWEYPIAPRSTSGLLSTAGDLVFGGTIDGYFFAVDAVSGEELWHMTVGARVHAAPISYAVGGQQYVSIAAGNVVFTFGLAD